MRDKKAKVVYNSSFNEIDEPIMKKDMSLLTGKCEVTFKKYIQNKMYYLGTEKLGILFLSALYIEFFDSVEIYISIRRYNGVFEWRVNHKIGHCYGDTLERPKATYEAIHMANDIYNKQN